jgi:glycosyltransferase involved in cell wall biosynthesis
MKILYVIHQFMPEFFSGTEQVTMKLANAAQASGHQVDVLTCSLQPDAPWSVTDEAGVRFAIVDGVPVHALPIDPSANLAHLGFDGAAAHGALTDRFLDARPAYDLVHVTHAMRMIETVERIQQRRIPCVLTLTDFFLACYRINLVQLSGAPCRGPAMGAACSLYCAQGDSLDAAWLTARQLRLRLIVERAAEVVACSEFVADVFRREHPERDISVIPHGIDLLRFNYRSRRVRDGAPVFGYLGTLSEAKGVHILAEAFARASKGGARLEIVGPHYDNAFALRLREIAAHDPQITISAPIGVDAVPAALSRFDVLCLPSLVPETFSLAIHEGFAAGLPCLVSDLGHPGRVVREHGCGEGIPPAHVGAWSDCVARIASNPDILDDWKQRVPLPWRVEEETFLYSQMYRRAKIRAL